VRKRFGTVRRAIASGAFGHGPAKTLRDLRHDVPYWGKSENEERGRGRAKHLRLRCVLLGAQAEAYATLKANFDSVSLPRGVWFPMMSFLRPCIQSASRGGP
jgi:hypothetical protein